MSTLYKNNDVLIWLESMREKSEPYGKYRISTGCKPTLLASCFAVITRELIGNLKTLDNNSREQWISYIQQYQNSSTGLFFDPSLDVKTLTTHGTGYLERQFTYFALHALDALGVKAKYKLSVTEKYLQPGVISQWLASLDWSRPWYESNEVMFLLTFLFYELRESDGEKNKKTLIEALDWLDDHQDPSTGYWGTDCGASLFDAMAGAFHIYLFYYFVKRPVQYVDTIIDSTLSLQENDGLFSPFGGGGSCEDLDAIDILVNMKKMSSYRTTDINSALEKSKKGTLDCRNTDGGFRWITKRFFGLSYWLKILNPFSNLPYSRYQMCKIGARNILKPRIEKIVYSGWNVMEFPATSSDIWSSWFRLLILAEIENSTGKVSDSWCFRNLPGLGWFDPNLKIKPVEESIPMDSISLPYWNKKRAVNRYQFALTKAEQRKIILEVGFGSGWGSQYLSSNGSTVFAVDKQIGLSFKETKHENNNSVKYCLMDMQFLGIRSKSIDMLVVFETIEHVPQDVVKNFILESRRILKDDGILVGSTPVSDKVFGESNPKNPFHIFEYGSKQIHKIFGESYQNVNVVVLSPEDVVFTANGVQNEKIPDKYIDKKVYLYYKDLATLFMKNNQLLAGIRKSFIAFSYQPLSLFSWVFLSEMLAVFIYQALMKPRYLLGLLKKYATAIR